MRFKDAIARSIEAYYSGKLPTESIDEEFPYTLEYFEELEKTEPEDTEEGSSDEDNA